MALPSGTVTFWMTDIEGSTRLLRSLGPRYAGLLATHHALIRAAVAAHGGVEISTEGDSFFCVFHSARAAVDAAVTAQRGLAAQPWPDDTQVRVRMGMHTGEAEPADTGYVGLDVHRAARVAAAAHGGQVLLTAPTRALLEGAWPPGVGYVFLGSHRLKDLDAPELLYQLVVDGLPTRFPPVRSLEAPAYDLPSTPSTFVGREEEVETLAGLLEEHRLVTITGPGGVGKTRLAVRTAARVSARFPGGVAFVGLAVVDDPDLVPAEVARALALPAGEYTGPRGLQRLADQLAGRRMLLLLDNVEQLVPGAARIGALLDAVPDLTIIATSRSPLRLRQEQEYPLLPLPVPEAPGVSVEQLLEYPAVRQFVDRARAARPDFELTAADAEDVACIVRGVDGLPLAIELVAARLRTLSVAQVAARLGNQLGLLRGGPQDLPPRQQALRETLRWSYHLLEPAGRALLPVFAAFPGGATLDALEQVAGAVVDPDEVLDALESLVGQGLVLRSADSSDRFRTLQVVREMAGELLRECGAEEEVRRAQALWTCRLAAEAGPLIVTDRQAEALNRIRDEHDNLRAALAWATDADPVLAGGVAAAMWRYWQMRGHLAEGAAILDRILQRLPAGTAPRQRAAVLSARGGIAYWQFDVPGMRRAYGEAVELAEQLGDEPLLAASLYDLAFPVLQSGQFEDVDRLSLRAEELFERAGDRHGAARARWMRGLATLRSGDPAAAEALFVEAVARFRELGDTYYLGWSLRMLGRSLLEQGTVPAARAALGDTYYLGWSLRMLGRSLLEQGTVPAARAALGESLQLFAPAGDISAVVLHLADFAALAGLEGDPARQLRLVGAMRHLRRTTGTHLVDYEVNRIDHLERSTAQLGDRAAVLLAEGEAMTVDQAVACALEG